MDMNGERRIPAPRAKVWEGLNDPEILRASIPGCESLEKTSDTEFKATAAIKIGPIAARFTGKVALTDIDPPNGYRIGGEGQGGVAGFAKGGATVALAEEGAETLLTYTVQAQVGGKIAQLGARLVDATARSMAEQFFTRFAAQVSPAAAPVLEAAALEGAMAAGTAPAQIPPATPSPGAAPPTELPPEIAPVPAPPPATSAPSVSSHPIMMPANQPTRPLPPAPASVNLLSLIPKEIGGFPLVAWIGAAICFVIFVMLFGSLL